MRRNIQRWRRTKRSVPNRKAELVHTVTNLTVDREQSQSPVRKLTWRSSGLNVASIKEDHIAHLELQSWRLFPIVVECHVLLQLGQSRLCFLQGVPHPVSELITSPIYRTHSIIDLDGKNFGWCNAQLSGKRWIPRNSTFTMAICCILAWRQQLASLQYGWWSVPLGGIAYNLCFRY